MNYPGADVETASISAGDMRDFRVTHTGRPALPILDIRAFDDLMNGDVPARMRARHIEQIMDVVPQHMFMLEPSGALSFVNRAAREYLGKIDIVSPSERLRAIIHPDDFDGLLGSYRDAMAHEISVEAEARVRSKNGQYRWFLHQLFPLSDEHGRIVRWCGTRIDIDEHKTSKGAGAAGEPGPAERNRRDVDVRRDRRHVASFAGSVGTSREGCAN